MLLEVNPTRNLGNTARIPSSKPETQRAILAATLADGVSLVYNDLRCLETETMKKACQSIGAVIEEYDTHLKIHGVGRNFKTSNRVIDALGSGLVFRTFTALTCFSSSPSIISGDNTLRARVMQPLFSALNDLGASLHCIIEEDKAPVVNWGGGFKGGYCEIPGNVSSQFITAVLFAAPLAEQPTEVNIVGEILSISYIRQTVHTLRKSGIKVEVSRDFRKIKVYPGEYQAAEHVIGGDYTSSSYVIAAATMFPGMRVLQNMNRESLQGESAIIDILEKLGIEVCFNDTENSMTLINSQGQLSGDFEFDASDYPNIVPTLAAIGAYVDGTFRVVGGSITRLHKAPRIKAMISELKKLGVDIKPLYKDGVYDGFEIHGKSQYEGGQELTSWGDHRIFMSLFVASLRCKKPNYLDGFRDVVCSFPDFFEEFEKMGVTVKELAVDDRASVYKEA